MPNGVRLRHRARRRFPLVGQAAKRIVPTGYPAQRGCVRRSYTVQLFLRFTNVFQTRLRMQNIAPYSSKMAVIFLIEHIFPTRLSAGPCRDENLDRFVRGYRFGKPIFADWMAGFLH